jgi:uncharacterized protein
MNPRKPFRINVGFIIHEEVGYTHDFPFEFDEVPLGDDLELRAFRGTARIGRTPQGLIVQGEFSGELMLECSRCLVQFWRPITWGLTELYAFSKKSVSESGLLVPDDAQIDLEPLMREYSLLEVPINPVHKPDCRGLCVTCGEDLNVRDCGHRPPLPEWGFPDLGHLN